MARTSSNDTPPAKGFGDIIGIVLISMGILILISLISYDRKDLAFNHMPPNDPKANWIGPVGAYTAHAFLFTFGVASYLLPVFLLGYGISFYVQTLEYLRRSLLWMALFMMSMIGFLDLFKEYLSQFASMPESGSPGGILGFWMNLYVFGYFGQVGAGLIFSTVYVVSLLYLTHFQIGSWMKRVWSWLKERKRVNSSLKARDEEFKKKSDALNKEAERLRKETEKVGIESVPNITIRDLSVSPQGNSSGTEKEPNITIMGDSESAKEGGKKRKTLSSALNPFSAKKTSPEKRELPVESEDETEADIEMEGDLDEPNEPKPATREEVLGIPRAKPSPTATPSSSGLPPRKLSAKRLGVAIPPVIGNYKLPGLQHFMDPDKGIKPTESKESLMANARLMQTTLAQFGIEVALGDITKGPTITRYELHPAPGVRLEKIVALTNNITAALKAERIHVLAPVPGKSSVGIEVPNKIKTKVIMKDLLESEAWVKSKAKIPLTLGKDVYGDPIIGDLAEMPHLLIAGSTGSGKSVCINAIIASLLYRFSPEELRFVMIDPKVVELQQYNSLPHLVVPVVTDPKKVVLALRWVVQEMEKRYQIFAKVGVRNVHAFNTRPKTKKKKEAHPELPLNDNENEGEEGFAVELDKAITVPREDEFEIPEKLSYIVVIIDELADLMLVAPADVEMSIARITQMARAAGIHCIVATQRPSVDVITGVIKANIPARIAFQVASKVDSRTILDAMGADKLLGKGDMLYLPPGGSRLIRAQGVLITDEELESMVESIVLQGQPSYEMEIHQELQKPVSSLDGKGGSNGGGGEDDELIEKCIEVIRSEQKASVSLLQRRLRLGYTRAARIMDQLEDMGIVGPNKGAEPRDILLDLDAQAAAHEDK